MVRLYTNYGYGPHRPHGNYVGEKEDVELVRCEGSDK